MVEHRTDSPPQQLGKYRLVKQLKKGGEARIYQATDDSGKIFAIRVLLIHENTADVRRRFRHEVEHLEKLRGHPHIIPLLDSGLVGQWAYLVMPYIPDGSLADQMKNGRQFSSQEILLFLEQTADALAFAHSRGIIHRDVKPDNLLHGSNGILLSDFGIAFNAESETTDIGNLWGSRHFLAPEQAKGQSPSHASDQYSLAATACYLLTRRYFDVDGDQALPQTLPSVASLLKHALDQDATKRFSSMKEFAAALKQAKDTDLAVLRTVPVPPPPFVPTGGRPPGRSRFFGQAVTILLTMFLTFLVLFFSVRLVPGFLLPPPAATSTPAPHSSMVVKIGVDLPLSGTDLSQGEPMLNAIKLAMKHYNSTVDGYTLELDIHDDVNPNTNTHDATIGQQNIGIMANDAQDAAIIGPFNSEVAIQEIPSAISAGIALISPATTSNCLTDTKLTSICQQTYPSFHPGNQTSFFRLAALDSTQGTELADYLKNQNRDYTTACIIEDKDAYGLDLGQAFQQAWGNNVQVYTITADDLSSATPDNTINRCKLPDPLQSVIFYAGTTPVSTAIYALIEQDQQLQGVTFATGGGSVNTTFVTNLEGLKPSGPIYAVAPVGSQKTPESLQFYADYIATYSEQPTLYSASAYDCASILIQAIEYVIEENHSGVQPPTRSTDGRIAQPFRKEIIRVLQNTTFTNSLITSSTGYSFTPAGDANPQEVSLYQFNNTSQQWEYQSTTYTQLGS